MSLNKKLGSKHLCKDCGCLFYDLLKPTPKCPRCNSTSFVDILEGQVYQNTIEPARKRKGKKGSSKKKKRDDDYEPIPLNNEFGLLDNADEESTDDEKEPEELK